MKKRICRIGITVLGFAIAFGFAGDSRSFAEESSRKVSDYSSFTEICLDRENLPDSIRDSIEYLVLLAVFSRDIGRDIVIGNDITSINCEVAERLLPSVKILELNRGSSRQCLGYFQIPPLTDVSYYFCNGHYDAESVSRMPRFGLPDSNLLRFVPNLTRFRIWNGFDISHLRFIPNLTLLTIADGFDVSDFSYLESLSNLEILHLGSNAIPNLDKFRGLKLTRLKSLRVALSGDKISNYNDVFATMPNLTQLNIVGNNLSDVSALASARNLTELSLWAKKASDMSSLTNLLQLKSLAVTAKVSNIQFVRKLSKLTHLSLGCNEISDISALSSVSLSKLKYISLFNNQIKSIEPLHSLTNLTQIDLNGNQIENVESLSSLTNLTQINLDNNKVSNINSLHQLPKLLYVYVNNNPISSSGLIPQARINRIARERDTCN